MGCAGSKSTGNHHAISNPGPASAVGNQYKYEAFLSHDWGKDELGRNNHDRVKKIFQALKEKGLSLWFDEVYMEGDIDKAMCKGIDESKLVIIFITKRYMQKVAGDNDQDNCQKEFNYAKQKEALNGCCVLSWSHSAETPILGRVRSACTWAVASILIFRRTPSLTPRLRR